MWIITLEYLEWFLKLNQQFIDRYSKFCYNAIVSGSPCPMGPMGLVRQNTRKGLTANHDCVIV